MATTTTYSNASNARRAAKRQGLQDFKVEPRDGRFEIVFAQPKPVEAVVTDSEGTKNRSTSNGVTERSSGGACAAAWELCDLLYDKLGKAPKPSQLKHHMAATGSELNVTNVVLELYQWRKFHSIGKDGIKAA